MTLHLVYSDWQFDSDIVFTDDLDNFSLILKLLALILDLSSGGESWCYFWLHCVDDLEVIILWFSESNPFGPIGEVPNLDSYFIVLVDFDVFEDNLCRDDLKAL